MTQARSGHSTQRTSSNPCTTLRIFYKQIKKDGVFKMVAPNVTDDTVMGDATGGVPPPQVYSSPVITEVHSSAPVGVQSVAAMGVQLPGQPFLVAQLIILLVPMRQRWRNICSMLQRFMHISQLSFLLRSSRPRHFENHEKRIELSTKPQLTSYCRSTPKCCWKRFSQQRPMLPLKRKQAIKEATESAQKS